jgi:hypothetical protein
MIDILFLVGRYTKVNLVLYASTRITACVVIGYIMSFVIPEKKKEFTAKTVELTNK